MPSQPMLLPSKSSTIRAQMQFILHTAHCFVSCFSSCSHPKGRRAPGGCKLHASIPSVHRAPGSDQQGQDNKSPCAVHVLLTCNKTSPLQRGGLAQGKLREAQVPPECWDALAARSLGTCSATDNETSRKRGFCGLWLSS